SLGSCASQCIVISAVSSLPITVATSKIGVSNCSAVLIMCSASGHTKISSSVSIVISSIMNNMITISISYRSIISSVRVYVYYTIVIVWDSVIHMPWTVYIVSIPGINKSAVVTVIS